MATLLSLSSSPLVWAYLALMFFFFFISILFRGVRKDHSVVKGTRTEYLLFLIVNLAFIILPFTYAVTSVYDGLNYNTPPFLAILGLAGLVTAFLIRAKAHVDLGDNFTISPGTRRKRRLVTTGIYSRIRHPMYLAMMLWAISSPLVLHNYLVGMLPLAAIATFLLVRVPLEERGCSWRSSEMSTMHMRPVQVPSCPASTVKLHSKHAGHVEETRLITKSLPASTVWKTILYSYGVGRIHGRGRST